MTTATAAPSVTIKHAIVHRVHQRADAVTGADPPPLLADLTSPLDDQIERFLADHVVRSWTDYRARRADFIDQASANPIRTMCDTIFAHPDDVSIFVDQSRAIATELAAAAQGRQRADARITPGDLVVCHAVLGDAQVASSMLALLKIDPQAGFVGERTGSAGGKIQVLLKPVTEVLTDSRLLKCAFVLPQPQRAEQHFDLVVLDLQIDSRNASHWAASYFVDRFLQCRTGLNPDEELRVFIYDSGDFIDHHSTLNAAEKEQAKERVLQSAYDLEINVVEVAREIFPDETERDHYLEHLQTKGLSDLIFTPSDKRRRQLADYVTYLGDNDLVLRVRRDAYGQGPEHTVDPGQGVGANGRYTIAIHTTRWERRPV